MAFLDKHKAIETHATLLMVLAFLVVTIGGAVQILPLFYIENTIEKVDGMRPYTPLELAGRDIYIREGCYVCHSQMIRPMRDEVERYGHYSLAAESMYDHPFQWGSKRTGPDLARVGGRYSDEWHQDHFMNAKSVVPESVMPPYGFLFNRVIDGRYIEDSLRVNAMVGVPYTEDMIANPGRLCGPGRPQCRQFGSAGALWLGRGGEGQGRERAQLRRSARADRGRRADRLYPGSGHDGRLLDLHPGPER